MRSSLLLLAVCCLATPVSAQIAPEFHGVWTNVDARNSNWWEITAERVVNYGGGFKDGKCRSARAVIRAADRIDIQHGNTSSNVQLRILDDRLLLEGDVGTAYHRRVLRTAICRKADGSYEQGAPYRP